MNKTEKHEFVEKFHGSLDKAKVVLISHYKGLSVSEISLLREKIKENKAFFKVTKNSLAKRALKDTNYENLEKFFVGPTAVTYSDDPASAAKTIFNFSKDNEKLKIIAGAIGEKELSIEEIKVLANLPSIEEIHAKIVGLISSPLSNIVSILNQPSISTIRLLKAKFENEKS